jgi:hypothetical protein
MGRARTKPSLKTIALIGFNRKNSRQQGGKLTFLDVK